VAQVGQALGIAAAPWWWFLDVAVWLAAACSIFLLSINRWLIHLADGLLKPTAMVTALLLCAAAATWGLLGDQRWQLRPVPLVVLVVVAAGELRRAVLRYRARGTAPVSAQPPARRPWHPITTTDLVTRHHQIPVVGLGTRRLRVAHVTDLHVDERVPLQHYVSALQLATSCEPDLLLLTGDYVSRRGSVGLLSRVMTGRVRARYGVFGVLGNHDYWTDAAAVQKVLLQSGVELLAGRCRRLQLETNATVQVCGTERPWGPCLKAEALPQADLTLVLSHTPDNIYRLAKLGVTAVFGGHYHGGQLRIPGLGAVVVPSRYGRRFDVGHFRVGTTHLFVSSGVGADRPPLRIYARPDILIVDFVPPT
jgi:predicted MPP superfamily phosphohydrolase